MDLCLLTLISLQQLRRSDVLRVLRGLLLLDELHPSSSLSIVKAIPAISGAKFAID